jgi:hypothetical protein
MNNNEAIIMMLPPLNNIQDHAKKGNTGRFSNMEGFSTNLDKSLKIMQTKKNT